MKTTKYICVCAALLMSLLTVSVPAQASGNDWFEKSYNFDAYYDGMGTVSFNLLVWTEGAGHNHWASDSYPDDTYVEYSTDNINWKKLFYYHGDNSSTPNHAKVKVMVENYGIFTASSVEMNPVKQLTKYNDWEDVTLVHGFDERRSVTLVVNWALPQDMDNKKLWIRLHICDQRTTGHWNYTYDLMKDKQIEPENVPELSTPIPYSNTNDLSVAGWIQVPYFMTDEPIKYYTNFNKTLVYTSEMAGMISVPSFDSIQHNLIMTAEVKRSSGVEATVRSKPIDVPAFHRIYNFQVTEQMESGKTPTGGSFSYNTGAKVLTWQFKHPMDEDVYPMDYFEIERAYKADFSDATNIATILFGRITDSTYLDKPYYTYQYIDDSDEAINNPNSDSIYYRIRRQSSSCWGWQGNPFAASTAYTGSIRQMGMDLYDPLHPGRPYVTFKDCSMDMIDIVGEFVWPDSTMLKSISWDPNTTVDIVLAGETSDMVLDRLTMESFSNDVHGSCVKWSFSYQKPLPITCRLFDLVVRLNTDGTRIKKPTNTEVWFHSKIRTSAVQITKLDATRGNEDHPEYTYLFWEADGEPSYFLLSRQGEGEPKPLFLDTLKGDQYYYSDYRATPGKKYDYFLDAITDCGGNPMPVKDTIDGLRSPFGYIDGYLTYANGDKVANIEVGLYNDGSSTPIATVRTDVNGYYKFSHIAYDINNGSKYEVGVNANQTFTPAKGGNKALVRLNKDACVAHNVDFVSGDYFRYSGRVLYTGTTIPVRDAYFLINGHVAMASGDTIRTNATGNFEVSVPAKQSFTFTVKKDKHTFLNDGKLIINNSVNITATENLYGIILWDETRVRLIGRLAGGEIEGLKPLGFGLSTNNLGDSLKLVFELEGDNIAHFVYDDKDFTKKTRDTVFNHYKEGQQTRVHYEEKRVIVYPDSKTGEYMIDLPPVKYRIVEATANGYATLFSAGRTSETKDLTNSLDVKSISHGTDVVKYNDTYSVIYHSPAVVRVQQKKNGQPIDFYGEQEVPTLVTKNGTPNLPGYKDGKYTFGYPVFYTKYKYTFAISAREEYHYNNTPGGKMTFVPLANMPYTVYNGFVSGTPIISKQCLDENGQVNVIIPVSDVSYGTKTEDALKHLDVSVAVNGQDVHADPIFGFVVGERIIGTDAMQKVGSIITVNDVLRDPPGSNSYAWIEKGATYTTKYKQTFSLDFGLGLTVVTGKAANTYTGTVQAPSGAGTYNGFSTITQSGETYPIVSYNQGVNWNPEYTYTYTLSSRVQTCSDNTVMGEDAKVFIGTTTNVYTKQTEQCIAANKEVLKRMKKAINAGEVKIIAENSKDTSAIVVMRNVLPTLATDTAPVQFAYTQDHIVNQIIPQLISGAAALLQYGDSTGFQARADKEKRSLYWVTTVPKDSIIWIKPKTGTYVNEVKEYVKTINSWLTELKKAEDREVNGTSDSKHKATYSVSANTSYTVTETGYSNYVYYKTDKEDPGIADGLKGLSNKSFDTDPQTQKVVTLIKKYITSNGSEINDKEISTSNPVFKTSWKIEPHFDFDRQGTKTRDMSNTRTIGFTLAQNEYGYIDVAVFGIGQDSTFNKDNKDWRTAAINDITRDDMKTGNYDCSDLCYKLLGGATRCPWIDERKTMFQNGYQSVLDNATLKLDEAHLDIDQHEISGVAADGVAVFDVQIWNETQAAPGVANGPHNFVLKLLDGSNPYGAKASIDGLPLTGTGRNFYLSPGQVIHKKMEVRQGALALDYDSLKLCLMSDCDTSNYATQPFSVHFLPASTPVHIATPDDKWVMNTNSPYDKQGYYLPVVIDGFDPEYANFDHIELQYKLSTQSDNNWVTLCSYFVDKTYYDKASGNKQMFKKEAGRIDNIHFYGERDPMEQRYDLRAVSYCRYGTGYVSKASEPVSGIKDTRRPELFGKVTPANGVLTQQDYISVPFSEPIAYNYLDETNNFEVIGFTNKASYFDVPTLAFSPKNGSYAQTKVVRNLSETDFTIDVVAYHENTKEQATYFSTGTDKDKIEFGWNGTCLYANIGGTQVLSDPVTDMPHQTFIRVIMAYDKNNKKIYFYTGNKSNSPNGKEAPAISNFSALLKWGADIEGKNILNGRMAEARIWSKVLNSGDISGTSDICLTGYESGLLAYYPMTEGYGKIAYDHAHGANADLINVTWSMPQGRALEVPNSNGIELDPQYFNNGADADYTLIFCFRSNTSKPFSGDALLFGDVNAKTDATNKQVGIFMTQEGKIKLVSENKSLVADGNYNDGAWHTLGLVVGSSFNYTHLYIDNQLKALTDGQFFGAWAMSQTFLGRNFNGFFDELSIWEFAMPQAYLSEFASRSPNGQELGLRCYLPFDQRIKNASSIYETHYSPLNAKYILNPETGEWKQSGDKVVRTSLSDENTTTNVCPLIRDSEYKKMKFSWTARDNDLVINLKMPDAEVNRKSIFFSLRDVEDLQGNRLLNPIAWTVYLDRNIIRWREQNLWVEKSAGMMDTVVYTTITNYSGEAKSFIISGLPDWLTVDEPIGMLQPQEERVLAFTISADLNAGDYVVPVALTDENNLTDQMLVNVRVNAVFPNWSIPNSLNLNMNLIGTVHLQDETRGSYVDTDTRDIVGAFYGNTCVGMQTITSKIGSTANLYLKVYGNTEMNKKDISLRLWQASTGKTYILQPEKEVICFVPDTVYGSIQKPVQLRVADLRVQNIPVYTGWNWISFYVKPDKINSSFITTGGFSSNDLIKVYGEYGYKPIDSIASSEPDASVYTQNKWSNNIALNNNNIYMLRVSRDMVVEVRGLAADKVPELTFRHGWNNLPCLFEANTPLDAAMADYFNAAKNGDIITGYYQFAVFDNKQWVGSLETLIPGEGYMLYRQDANDVTVHFYPAPASAPRRDRMESGTPLVNGRSYSTVMPIVAALEDNDATYPNDAILRAYAHDELVGEAQAVNGMWFLLVHATDGNELTFTVTDDKGKEQPASNILNYGSFTPTGTIHNPYLIRFGGSVEKVIHNDILYIHRNGHVYDAQGAFVR